MTETDIQTRMDRAYQHMQSLPDNDTAGLRFYETFSDANLSVLINADLSMQVFETSQGKIVLAFDTDDRMAEFVSEPTEFMKIPGRELVMRLLGTDTGVGLNLNVAPTSQILTPEILVWLSDLLSVDSTLLQDQAVGFTANCQSSSDDIAAISSRLENFAGRVSAAYMCGISYSDGVTADALIVVDCDPSVEADLFTAVIETQKFAENNATDLAIKFITSSNPTLSEIRRIGQEIHIPKTIPSHPAQPKPPGMDPDKPPILR